MIEKLKLFTTRQKPRFFAPWVEDGYIYASDTMILVRIPHDGNYITPADLNPHSASKLPVSWDFKGTPHIITYDEMHALIGDMCNCHACKPGGKRVKCPECEGEGFVILSNKFNEYECECISCSGQGNTGYFDTPDCPVCEGHGVRRSTKMHKVGDTEFDATLLYRLTRALGDITLFPNKPTDATRFSFNGGDGIVMPMRSA